jgi:hypothetical protein
VEDSSDETGVAIPSGAALRRALRDLPSDRRKGIGRAVREGRCVDDPRDAALAVALARRMQRVPWLRWALPETRPTGKRKILWIGHAAFVLAALVVALVFAWNSLGLARWIFLGVFAYGVISVPWVLSVVLRMRWNAPEAERRNRELLASHPRSGDIPEHWPRRFLPDS